MLNTPLSLRLTTGLVVLMICSLLLAEALGFHLEYMAGMIIAITLAGVAISLSVISRSHNHIDLAAIAPTLLRSTLDALTEGVVLIDNKGRIVIANAAFADIVGTTAQKLKGASLSGFGWKHVNEYEQQSPWAVCTRKGSPLTEQQMYLLDQRGDKKLYVVDCAPAMDSRGKHSGVMVTFDDVTRREAKNDQLEVMLGMLKKSRDEIRRQNEVLQELATRDSLTNCLNRRSFFEKYEIVFRAAQQDAHPLACIMTDIDLFKSINDRYGHTRGDDVIFNVAETLYQSLRSTDKVCRYGGEEFCIILPGIDLAQAIEMSENARGNIARLNLAEEPDNESIAVTSSFGVASIEHQPGNLSELIDRADKALYHSKHSGRNRVTAWLPGQFNHEEPPGCRPAGPAQATAAWTARRYPPGNDTLPDLDSLTGLPNRKEFHSSIVTAVESSRSNQKHASVMMLDLDMFNRINSTLGYDIGDELLKVVSYRIVDVLRDTDSVSRLTEADAVTSIYRLGGDEFGILLSGLDCTEFTGQIVSRIVDSVTSQVDIQGHEIHLSCSVGISLFPHDGSCADTLLKNASTALYFAKLHGQNNYQFYSEKLNRDSLENLQLENDLRHAIERNELDLYYQPKIDLASGRVNSVEALLRWRHPEIGMVPPDEFIPIAEKTGLITALGYWVLETACLQIRQWQDSGHEQLTVAVNLSAVQFRQLDLLERIHDTLEATAICAHQLELEITESTIMDDIDIASSTMRALHASGIRISIDDFGTGYSSLSHLKRFPIKTVKIDRSFIRDITSDPDDAAIVGAIIVMAHNMGLRVIAEGVETQQQLDFLHSLHCDEIQGFLFSPPVPHHEACALLEQRIEVQQTPVAGKKRAADLKTAAP
jgi:diguanylate cyclase (GGDEF)-like protein/PAS domain S-box-containing protein